MSSESVAHPLDPLSAEEIRAAVAILRRERDMGPRRRFGTIEPREPPKAALREGGALPREAILAGIHHVTRPEEWPP